MKKKSSFPKMLSEQRFNRLTPAKRRLLIAQDVLAQLDAKKYVATAGLYIEGTMKNGDNFDPMDGEGLNHPKAEGKDDPVYELLKADLVKPGCFVCAAGAACLSAIRLFDKAKYYDSGGLELDDTVHKYFPPAMRWRMEGWFEMNMEGWFEMNEGDDDWHDLKDAERLRAIYMAIEDDDGDDFNPKKDDWWWPYVPRMKAKMEKEAKAQKEIDAIKKQLERLGAQREKIGAQWDKLDDRRYELQEAI